jgi:hypothetical protein
LEYNPITGALSRILGVPGASAGSKVGTPQSKGYLELMIDRKRYLAHRIIWFYMTKGWPKDQIDHINGNRSDNRWINLREATGLQNNANSKIPVTNTSGLKGVTWQSQNKKWRAQLSINNKQKYLGSFETKEEAYLAYCQAAKELRGEYARFG